ncbi:mak, putative [Ricinus communis]|uniref:Mak, putative n=1 Tax=Ricinus communis TaxID=3988 RepID=B9T3W0_RICCO|nr:mak, putative [Ricinus communis]
MEKYEFIEKVGHGSYGSVWKAINNVSREMVPIKILKKNYSSWDEGLNLREGLVFPNLSRCCRHAQVKIGDLGLAREINSKPPYTDYVVTCCYRAPELLLRSSLYGSKVDMWSLGVVMAELFTFTPLFCGKSETDHMYKICKIIGSPTKMSYPYGLDLARNIHYQFPESGGMHLSLLMPTASKDALSLFKSLCSWDPCKRPTAEEALQHPFFHSCYSIPPAIPYEAPGIIRKTPVSSIR